jgi:VWFA-related protein
VPTFRSVSLSARPLATHLVTPAPQRYCEVNSGVSRPNNISRFTGRLLVAIFAFAALAQSQSLAPDEVRVTSHPYPPQHLAALRVNTELVEIEAVPRDSRGRSLPNLKQEYFEVYDDGKLRPIKAFTVAVAKISSTAPPVTAVAPDKTSQEPAQGATSVAPPPRSIALFFDDIHTNTGDLGRAKIAARRFLSHGLAPTDRLAIFTSSGTVFVDYTSDAAKILAALNVLQAHIRVPENGIAPCPRITPYQAYLIINNSDSNALQAAIQESSNCNGSSDDSANRFNNDLQTAAGGSIGGAEMAATSAIRAQAEQTWAMTRQATQVSLDAIENSLDSLARQPGSRMLLLVSSGFLAGTMSAEQDALIAQAVRSGTVINALDAKGLYSEVPGPPPGETSNGFSQKSMQALIFGSVSMGFKLSDLDAPIVNFTQSTGGLFFHNNNDLDLGFQEIGMLPEFTYLLAIEPARDGKYHHLHLKIRVPGTDLVQARPGYFAPARESVAQSLPVDKMDAEVHGSNEKNDVPTTITEKLATTGSGAPQLTIQTRVDIHKLPFDQQKDRRIQKLTFIAALFDARDNFVTGKQADMQLALKPESFDRLSRTGISGVMQLEASPGAYRLRIVVQEALHGNITATTKDLQIP